MVEISVGWSGEFERAEADVIEGFIVNTVGFICVLYQLVDREGGVVRLHHGVRHFGGRHHAKGVHDAIGVLLANLANQQGAHAGASASAQRVSELEALEAIAALSLFPHYIQNRVHQLCSLSVVALGPVISSSTLACSQKYSNL